MAKKLPVGKPKTRWFLPWIRGYQVAWLRPDLLAGVTLTALLLPQAIGYARIANMPPSAALAMVPVSLAVYGCAGGSLHLVVATNSAISLTSAATIAQFDGPPVDLSMALALTAGVILLAAGLLRLGFLADFMARPVMEGFLMGLALIIFVNQLPDLLGVPSEKDGFVATALAFARELPEINPWSALIGVSALGLMFGLSKALPRFPGSLIAVVLGIVAVRLFGLEDLGVRTVGDLPPMDLNPRLPSVDGKTLVAMAPAALGIAVIALGESISAGRKIAAKHDYEITPSREMRGLGLSNLAAGLVGGFAVSGSLSASQVNEAAGAKTPVSIFTAAILFLAVAYLAASTIESLPIPVLAAVIIQAIQPMLRPSPLLRIARLVRTDFALALITLVAVLLAPILHALLGAVLLSLSWLLYRTTLPRAVALGIAPGEEGFDALERNPGAVAIPGLLIFRLEAPLFFANARQMELALLQLLRDYDAKAVVIDMEFSFRLDSTTVETLHQLLEKLREQHVTVYLARMHAPVREVIERSRIVDRIGKENILNTIGEAVQRYREP